MSDLYREHILDHYQNPRNFGDLPGADVSIEHKNPACGDKLKLMYKLDGDRVTEVGFTGEGCAISIAGASILTELADGKTISELNQLTDAEMLKEIGVPLSPTRVKCGLLALSALRKGLKSRTAVR